MMPVSQSVAAPRLSPRLFTALLFLLALFSVSSAQAQLTGTRNIPGDYADLALAIADLNTQGVGAGGVTLNLVAGNPQTAPAGGYAITTLTGAAGSTITIQGNGNTVTAATPQASGLLHDAIFEIIGADFVTITGFTMQENAANTTTAAGTNNMTEWGVALQYASTTDGAQNITLSDNTITLNRAYQNTFGIYSNSVHSSTAVTTSASATTSAGANSGLKIYGNTISNVNIGIVVVGPLAAADHNDGLDIGGIAAGTGNTLSNFGTTGTFSGYSNVSGSVNGVLIRNTKNYNVSFNTITSSAGGTTAGTLRAIYVPSFTNAPIGTIANTINRNNISVQSGVVTGAINGIVVESTTSNATATSLGINNNNFSNSTHTIAAASGAMTFISYGTLALNQSINGNTFSNLSVTTTGSVTFITIGTVPVLSGGSLNVNSNEIVTGFTKTGVGGTVTFYTNNASPVNGSTASVSNNIISNVNLTGGTAFTGISATDGASGSSGPTKTVNGNTINGITSAGAITPMVVTFSGANSSVASNTISNVSGGGAITALNLGASNQATITASNNIIESITTTSGVLVGIAVGSPTINVTQNRVSTLSSSAAAAVTGIAVTAGTTVGVSRNKIYDLSGSNAASTLNGVLVSGGTTVNVFNNLIGDLRAPNASAANPLNGINLTSTAANSTLNVSYNTVMLNASSVGATFGSSGIFHAASATASTATLNLRNNVIANNSSFTGTGLTVAYRRTGAALANYGSVSNNNDFHAGTPGASNLIFTDGTNSDQTLATYKTRVVARDSASVSESPPFLSTTGSSPQFLHINPAVATQLESGGVAISGITTDFDGDTRNASTPDIGADEFAGILLDLNPPLIVYTALSSTTLTGNRVLSANITDVSGVAGSTLSPRVYFNKNAGTYVSTQCTGSSPAYACTIDAGLLGGVAATDVIRYFVVAQDTVGNVGSNPVSGFSAVDVNTVSTPPAMPNSYTIVIAQPAVATVGTGGTYTSLTNAGGLFEALNAGIFTSNIVIDITSDLTVETGAVALNPFVEEPAGSNFTLLIRPSGNRQVIGSVATNSLIDFNGADRVTIDGLNDGTNSLLIRNTGVAPVVRWVNDASDGILRNSTVEGASSSILVSVAAGIVTGNDNIQIAGNVLRDRSDAVGVPFNVVGSTSTLVALPNSNLVISNNTIQNFTQAGVFIGVGTENAIVSGNTVSQTAARTTAIFGIVANGAFGSNQFNGNTIRDLASSAASSGMVFNDVRDTVVTRNRVFNLAGTNASTSAISGIIYQGGDGTPSSITLNNNFVSIVPGFTNAQIVRGIVDYAYGTNTFSANFNSVYIGGTATGSVSSWAMVRRDITPTTHSSRNNILFNDRTGGVSNFAYGDQSAGAGTWSSNYNFVAGAGTAFMDYGTAAAGTPVTLSAWQAGPPARDANSIAGPFAPLSDFFVNAAAGDLHIQTTALPVVNAGTPIAGIAQDFDGDARNATTPEIGADELVDPNTAPVITLTAGGIARQQGSSSSNSQIAVVSDAESPAASLVVTTTSVPTGLTVSNIVNTGGAITADVVASCSATAGANSVGLRVTDAGTLFADAILTVNVSANAAPTLGVYPAAGALVAGAATVTPNAAPADNGSLASVTVAAPGFTGTLSVDAVTGVVTVSNAGPAGTYTVTVTATDNCGQASTATFVLTVNAANTEPTISASAGVSAKAGDPSASVLIATVADAEDAENTLAVTVNGGASASSNGITISGLAVTPSGAVNANVVASCSATNASFTLRVTDSGLLFDEDSLAVNVLANTTPTLSYGTTALQLGAGTTVNPATGPTDSGSIASVVVLSAGTFTGTASASLNGNVTLGNAGPVGSHTLTIRVTDNCTATRDAALLVNVLGDPIFGNGFEDLNMIPAQMQLPLGKAGELQRLSLPQFDLLHVTTDKALVNLVEFDIGGVVVLLQLRDQQLRLLSQDAEHGIVAGQWFDLIGSGTPQLQWVNRSVGDTLRVEAALTQD